MNSSLEVNRQCNGANGRAHGLRVVGNGASDHMPYETAVPDLATESRIEALRLLVLALLGEVDALKESVGSYPAKRRELTSLDHEVDAFEASLIREALIRTNGNQRDAAKVLKIKPSTLNAKMKRLGVTVETTITSVGR